MSVYRIKQVIMRSAQENFRVYFENTSALFLLFAFTSAAGCRLPAVFVCYSFVLALLRRNVSHKCVRLRSARMIYKNFYLLQSVRSYKHQLRRCINFSFRRATKWPCASVCYQSRSIAQNSATLCR